MTHRFLLTILCLAATLTGTLRAQDYPKMWKEAYDFWLQKDLPLSAIRQAQAIYGKARQEQDTAQMMRAELFCMYQRGGLSADSFYVDLPKLEKWAAAPSLSTGYKAVMHSVLGGIYQQALTRGKWANSIIAPRPDEVSSWTRLMYAERAFEHYLASIRQLEELQNYDAREVCAFVNDGKWSEYYNYSLMHLIGRRAVFGLRNLRSELKRFYPQTDWMLIPAEYADFISQVPLPAVSDYDCVPYIMHTFRRMLKVLEQPHRADAWLLMELSRLNITPQAETDLPRKLQALEGLKKEFADNDLCAEIHWALANDLLYQGDRRQAVKELQTAISRYPKYQLANLLKNKSSELELPEITVTIPMNSYHPGAPMTLDIRYRNLNRCTVWLHRMTASEDSIERHTDDRNWLLKHARFHSETRFSLTRDTSYLQRDTTLTLTLPHEKGIWLMEALSDGKCSKQVLLFDITALTVNKLPLPDGQTEFIVLDSKTGHPVPHATLFVKENNRSGQTAGPPLRIEADAQGQAVVRLPGSNNFLMKAVAEGDSSMRYRNFWDSRYTDARTDKDTDNVHLITDRTIYRPGQTIYIKGIVFRRTPMNDFSAMTDTLCTVELHDPKGTPTGSIQMRTNSYGSFSGELPLPESGINGACYLKARCGKAEEIAIVHVQEYKRPTFEVQFAPISDAYAIGDTVTLTGTARTYTGVPVAYGKVSYKNTKTGAHCLRGWTGYAHDWHTGSGETVTDEAGRFTIRVPLLHEKDPSAWIWWRASYNVNATVTSQAGESHEATASLSLSSCPLTLDLSSPLPLSGKRQRKAGDSITFKVCNLAGVPMQAQVDWQLYRNWGDGGLVCQGKAASNTPLPTEAWDTQPSGNYRLKAATALPGNTDSVSYETTFTLYGHNETKVPAGVSEWWHWTADEFAPGSPARLQFGTAKRDVYVMMDIFTKQQRIESRRFLLSDTVQHFTFDYLPHYGLGISVSLSFIKEGKSYSYSSIIRRKEPDKQLKLKWATFRDKLTPGSQEEWTLTVSHPDGQPAAAEVMARMYDASLDALQGNAAGGEFHLPFNRTSYMPWSWSAITPNSYTRLHIPFEFIQKKIPMQWRYADFDAIYTRIGSRRTALRDLRHTVGNTGISFVTEDAAGEEEIFMSSASPVKARSLKTQVTGAGIVMEESMADNGAADAPTVSLRTDFSETAFFQPHLRTDSTGQVKMVFTLPESLTRWHFKAFAHTQEMDYGTLEDYATAQKQFMVQPNLPRFVRTGDEVAVQATVSNLSARRIKGNARLELADPATGRTLLVRKEKFRVEADATEVLTFRFRAEGICTPLPVCRIVAEADGYSDGEQHYLPILTDKEWVTESLPLTLTGADTLTQSLTHLFNNHSRTATGHRLTVEFTGNPAWTALQALPAVASPTDDDAYAWAIAWYARRIATHIADTSPRIKAVFNQWQSANAGSEALWSQLEKNQELKNLILEETPWIAEAADEKEQHRRLTLLFDSRAAEQFNTLCTDKLRDLQLPSGGWSWHKGMPASRTMTTAIIELMHRATLLTGQSPDGEMAAMKRQAEHYLDQCLREEYDRMQKEQRQTGGQPSLPSEAALHYLYARTVGEESSALQDSIARYMIGRLPATPALFTHYGKACAAVVLHAHGEAAKAMDYLRSLQEHMVCHPQQGRFFDKTHSSYRWRNHDIATQVAAIEAIARLIPEDTTVVEEMKQWLLTCKQTRQWGTPTHTADAIYALLVRGADLLADGQPVTLLLDDRPVRQENAPIAGTDYLKRTYTGDDLADRLPNTITVQKSGGHLAWGAVYAQYLEAMEHLTASAPRLTTDSAALYLQPLSIGRQLLVERLQGGAPVWEPVTEETLLHKGDLIISRLTIKADRDMEFVQLKESRAACTEPESTASGYRFHQGLGYYLSVKDASTHYFFDRLPKGTHTIDCRLRIDRTGRYQAGPATIQCAYAPEFNAHTAGSILQVGE